MRQTLFAIVLVGLVFSNGFCQQIPLYTQYLFDPYLINPSRIATENRAEVNLLYNRQWTGIQDSPETMQADVQYPVNDRIALGLNIYEDRTVIMSNTSAMGTFGYKVPLGDDQLLGFGLSGGFTSRRLRFDELSEKDLNDPALYSLGHNNIRFNSQFGVHYTNKKLTVGFALLQLVDNDSYSLERPNTKSFNALRHVTVHSSYEFPLSDGVTAQPSVAYMFSYDKMNPEANQNYLETSLIFSFKDALQVGGGYRQYLGPLMMARFRVRDFEVGYAYGFPSTYARVSVGSTSEIQLKWFFGKEKELEKGEPDIYEEYNRLLRKIRQQTRKYRRMAE